MKLTRNLLPEFGLKPIDIIPLVNVVFLLLFFFLLSSMFAYQSGINVKLPQALPSDIIKAENLTITITSEDVIFWNGKIATLKELQGYLSGIKDEEKHPVLIRADRRASVGRIVDVWDICRNFGMDKVNIATTQN